MKREKANFGSNIYIRNGVYWYKGTPEGLKRQIERSLKIKVGATQKEVRKAQQDLLKTLGVMGSEKTSTRYDHLIERYILEKESEGLAEKTIYEIKSYLAPKYEHKGKTYVGKHLGPFLMNYRVEAIKGSTFDEYCRKNKKKNLRPHAKTLNAFLKWCILRDVLSVKPIIEVPRGMNKEKRQREILTNEEIISLLNQLSGRALLYHAMYMLMGMRNSEIVRLEWKDVNLREKSIWINPQNNRTRKEREIPINPFVYKMLSGLDHTGSEWVFPSRKGALKPYRDPTGSFRKEWKKALKGAGITRHLTPHDMRATFEKFMHTNTNFTDTQREKMAGAKIEVQKNIYVSMKAEDLRGLEESVQIEGLKEVFDKDYQLKSRANSMTAGRTKRRK